MRPDKEYDAVLDDPPISKKLLQRIEQMLPDITSVEVKYAKTDKSTPRKLVRFDFEGAESPDEIVGEIAQVAFGHAEKSSQAPDHFEAWVKREGKPTVHLRFKIDEFGDMRDDADASEMQVILATAMDFVNSVKAQNADHHAMIKELVTELRMMAAPQKDAMAEMGKIVAASYQQMYYAFSLISQEKAAEREAELSAQKWQEGFELAKEFLPVAVRQHLERNKPDGDEEASDDEDDDGDDGGGGESEDGGSDGEGDDQPKKRTKRGKKPKAALWEACQGFGAALDGPQMAKLRKALTSKQMEWLEKAMSADNDIDAAVAVGHLRKALSSQKMKTKLMNILPFGQIGLLGAILKGAQKVDTSAAAKRKAKTDKPTDDEESVSAEDD
jgi:hypothetical protein